MSTTFWFISFRISLPDLTDRKAGIALSDMFIIICSAKKVTLLGVIGEIMVKWAKKLVDRCKCN